MTDNGYWAFLVNHTSHAHTLEYELWLILINPWHPVFQPWLEKLVLCQWGSSSPLSLSSLAFSPATISYISAGLTPSTMQLLWDFLGSSTGFLLRSSVSLRRFALCLSSHLSLPSGIKFLLDVSATWDVRDVGLDSWSAAALQHLFFCELSSKKKDIRKGTQFGHPKKLRYEKRTAIYCNPFSLSCFPTVSVSAFLL